MNRKNATLKIRDFDLSVKAVSDDGLFSGYGSVFGTVDSYREVVAPGAFSESLAEIKSKGRPVPVLWQHRSGEPIGVYTSLVEDAHGLKVEGQLIIDGVARAKEAHALMKAGAVSGLSIGYYVREDSWDEKERVRTLKKVELVEISLVTFPANDDARIDAIKSKLAHGSLPTMPEFEQILREAGFSKSQSAVIANRGLKHLLDRSESGGKAIEENTAVPVLGRLTLPTF
ncbi:TPA: HK97 family phage prohead protease [Stenotrophomonas maltophilia]|uniref:HK97 family phage prohead protease n=1 Tax=Stenotrophomonas maltophilia TaxID=40324 RepID=A0AAI9FV25_STEMA|nr:HK97 family phage prohead protease [Stenotrophomonas maltophilia]HEL4101073.1 HK97 family phage prohead protease [Stenotrophomonas maltophilia]HEL5043491.1 HK97 family phage prohead protease [Stenotrophomonas maltophilia]